MAFAVGALLVLAAPASAESLAEALAAAYADNPTLNAQRASLRATDEGVPQALSGYRPTVSAASSIGVEKTNRTGTFYPSSVSLTVEQPLFLGFRTTNSVKMAETSVLAGREVLRSTEQTVLLDAVTAYMDVILAQALLGIRAQNIDFLLEQRRAAADRLNVGEGTRTDVAQTDAALALGRSTYSAAVANLNAARATYQQVIGHAPKSLGKLKSIDHLLPKSVEAGVAAGRAHHPSILAAGYNVDVAAFNVKVLEGQLLPSLTLNGSVSSSNDSQGPGYGTVNSGSIMAELSVPLYQGGLPSSEIREAKETLGQRRIEQDASRDEIRLAVVSAWGNLEAARAQIAATGSQTSAQQLVLSGVIEQRKVGQSTTLDVLTAQQDLLDARIEQVTAQRDKVVAAFTLLAAIGGLDAANLGLAVRRYQAEEHYHQVRDKWFGLRTPDGR